MFKKYYKVGILSIMVGILIGTSASIVMAATVSSSWGYYGPILDYQYRNMASITNDPDVSRASTTVEVYPTGSAPIGYMGYQARLYKSNGDLVISSNWGYNPYEVPAVETSVYFPKDSSSGYYYSKGLTSAYNGDGYTVYNTFQSPNLYFSF